MPSYKYEKHRRNLLHNIENFYDFMKGKMQDHQKIFDNLKKDFGDILSYVYECKL